MDVTVRTRLATSTSAATERSEVAGLRVVARNFINFTVTLTKALTALAPAS